MSGDHTATTNFKKELLTQNGFTQYRNTTLFKKNGVFVLSPAISKNQNGQYWFDVREAIYGFITTANKVDTAFLFARIIPNRFVVVPLAELQKAMKTHSKIEKTGGKVWSFEIANRFSVIANKQASGEKVPATSLEEEEAIDFLQSI